MNYAALLRPRRLLAALKGKLAQRVIMNQAIRAGKERFGADINYRPDLVPAWFGQRPEIARDDSVILKRIIAAYKRAKLDQRNAAQEFNVSNEWLPIYERNLGPVMRALLSENIGDVQRMYRNFFRDPCSTGLVGLPIDMAKFFFRGTIKEKYREYFLGDSLHRYALWQKRTGNAYSAKVLASPVVGNSYGYVIEGIFIRAGGDYQHYYAHAIGRLLASSKKKVVTELGGGFGGLAYYLARDNSSVTYVDFDLPETLALASYYLMTTVPNVPITLYGEGGISKEALDAPGILMMPSFEIMKMPSSSVAVSFNSYSLAEMSPSTIQVYIDQIARVTNRHFLHVNHNKKAVLSADNFGVEEHGYKLISRELAGWTLGINPKSDEYEYLYEKVGVPA
jgi:hypothetical protein